MKPKVDEAAFYAIKVTDERAADLEGVLGTSILPVTTREPIPMLLEGIETPVRCYLLDLTRIDKLKLVDWLAIKWNAPRDDVILEVEEKGVPIRAKGTEPVSSEMVKPLPVNPEEI